IEMKDASRLLFHQRIRTPVQVVELCAPKQFARESSRSPMFPKFVIALIGASLLWQPTAADQVSQVQRVLILNVYSPLASPGVAPLDQAIIARLGQSHYQIELYSESLDATLFPDEAHQRQFRDWYVHKYHDRKPDVIIAVGPEPIWFLARSHKQ